MLILFYALLLTGSRASIISVLGGSMIFITYSFLNIGLASFIFKIFVIVLSFFIGAYLIINPDLIHELFSFLNRKFSSPFSGREIAWSALISQIKETPFLGVGYRISTEAILRENSINISHSHNLFLTIVSEIGIIGFLLFSFLYIFPSIKFILNKNTEKISNLQLISNSILLAILINQFFEDMFEPFRFFFIWMFFVLFIIYTQKGQKIK